MASLDWKLVWTENGVMMEIRGSFASKDAAIRGRDRRIAEVEKRKMTYLYDGWYVIRRQGHGFEDEDVLGIGSKEGVPLPRFVRET